MLQLFIHLSNKCILCLQNCSGWLTTNKLNNKYKGDTIFLKKYYCYIEEFWFLAYIVLDVATKQVKHDFLPLLHQQEDDVIYLARYCPL